MKNRLYLVVWHAQDHDEPDWTHVVRESMTYDEADAIAREEINEQFGEVTEVELLDLWFHEVMVQGYKINVEEEN